MELVLDIFNTNPAFSGTTLTGNINVLPNAYGRLNALGLFRNEPVATTTVVVGIENGVLGLLPSKPRGAPPSYGSPRNRNVRPFIIPHIPHDDAAYAQEIQNQLAWGGISTSGALTASGLDSVLALINRKLFDMRAKHAQTLEYLRMGALTGQVIDATGTVLVDLFASFGVTQKSVDFAFGTTGNDLVSVGRSISGYMEDSLLGETMTGVYCLASPTFMDRLLKNATMKSAYNFFNTPNGQNPNRDDLRRMFYYGGITYEEYRGRANYLNEDGTTTVRPFIVDGEARFFPIGTTDTFVNYWAPPDAISLANISPSDQIFVAPLEVMKFQKGVEIHTESNPLPLVKRPNLLVRGYSSN